MNCTGNSNSGEGVQALNATNCYGTALGSGSGVRANNAQNSHGVATGTGNGISTNTASNCHGSATSGSGVFATTARGCQGASTTGFGINAKVASDCQGTSTSGTGVFAEFTASNCYGSGADGVNAKAANNCYGVSPSGAAPGYGIKCEIANGCYGASLTDRGIFAETVVMSSHARGGRGEGILLSSPGGVAAFSHGGEGIETDAGIIFGANPGGAHFGHQYFTGAGSDPYP